MTRLALEGAPMAGERVVVAIDGPSGAGKSTLAELVSAGLTQAGAPAPVVHMDDLYPGWDGLAQAVPRLVSEVLERLAHGGQAAYRRFDWSAGEYAERVSVPLHRYLVVEGVGSSVGPASAYAAVRVWVTADQDTRFDRGIERDGETYRPHWRRWQAQEDEMYARDRTWERAHLVIDTSPEQ